MMRISAGKLEELLQSAYLQSSFLVQRCCQRFTWRHVCNDSIFHFEEARVLIFVCRFIPTFLWSLFMLGLYLYDNCSWFTVFIIVIPICSLEFWRQFGDYTHICFNFHACLYDLINYYVQEIYDLLGLLFCFAFVHWNIFLSIIKS